MTNYLTRALPVKAVQWTGQNPDEIEELSIGAAKLCGHSFMVSTTNGPIKLRKTDWLVRNEHGGFTVLTDLLFNELYEPVQEAQAA